MTGTAFAERRGQRAMTTPARLQTWLEMLVAQAEDWPRTPPETLAQLRHWRDDDGAMEIDLDDACRDPGGAVALVELSSRALAAARQGNDPELQDFAERWDDLVRDKGEPAGDESYDAAETFQEADDD